MARNRVDDEEALIPRSDQGEYHPPTPRKKRTKCCCSLKCWFFAFFVLVIASTVLFYFVYPSVVHENINKFIGYMCTSDGSVQTASVTCIILTSADNQPAKVLAVNNTWSKQCTQLYFISETKQAANTELPDQLVVKDTSTLEYLSRVTQNNSTTTWYLVADDKTYVSYGKFDKYLAMRNNSAPIYLGQTVKGDVTIPYVINSAAVKAVLNKTDTTETTKIGARILNVTQKPGAKPTEPEKDKLYDSLTVNGELKDKVASLVNVPVFHDVTPEQMYAFYVTGDHMTD